VIAFAFRAHIRLSPFIGSWITFGITFITFILGYKAASTVEADISSHSFVCDFCHFFTAFFAIREKSPLYIFQKMMMPPMTASPPANAVAVRMFFTLDIKMSASMYFPRNLIVFIVLGVRLLNGHSLFFIWKPHRHIIQPFPIMLVQKCVLELFMVLRNDKKNIKHIRHSGRELTKIKKV